MSSQGAFLFLTFRKNARIWAAKFYQLMTSRNLYLHSHVSGWEVIWLNNTILRSFCGLKLFLFIKLSSLIKRVNFVFPIKLEMDVICNQPFGLSLNCFSMIEIKPFNVFRLTQQVLHLLRKTFLSSTWSILICQCPDHTISGNHHCNMILFLQVPCFNAAHLLSWFKSLVPNF